MLKIQVELFAWEAYLSGSSEKTWWPQMPVKGLMGVLPDCSGFAQEHRASQTFRLRTGHPRKHSLWSRWKLEPHSPYCGDQPLHRESREETDHWERQCGCGGSGQNPQWVLTSHWCRCLDRHCGCEENIEVLNRWRSALSDNTKTVPVPLHF